MSLLLCCLWCLWSQLLYHSSAECSGGHSVYATVRWQVRSTGWEDCVCDRFVLPHHVGSHTSSLDDLFQFVWRADAVTLGAYHSWRQSPHNCAVHNNILMKPWCSCWCQCAVTAQAKAGDVRETLHYIVFLGDLSSSIDSYWKNQHTKEQQNTMKMHQHTRAMQIFRLSKVAFSSRRSVLSEDSSSKVLIENWCMKPCCFGIFLHPSDIFL